MEHVRRWALGRITFWQGSPIRAERSISMMPALWSPGLSWKELQEDKATGRSWDTQMPSIGDTPWWEPFLKVAKVGRGGCAEITASQRE